ncbi:unnamed protein product [Caenorhabditis bovis]|uniref:EGF-like domain-containing protein n=1 Tax=Caenorhabditis bovis TaxID=2654633 RepID=A0A8S1F003_9PELO|nr:unnamed protein product [Caenorhabditis bovis]
MRTKRVKRAQVDESTMYPTYELTLKPDEEARAITKTLENIEIGSKLMLKCSMIANEFDNLIFMAGSDEIGDEIDATSKQFLIESFDKKNAGMYECGATRKSDKKYHSRQMRVSTKRENKLNLPTCSAEEDDDFCGPHGACFQDDSRKICLCDDGYMGERCDKVLMAAYEVKLLKVVGGTTTSLNIVWFFLAIIFALLFVREKSNTRRLRKQYESPSNNNHKGNEVYRETTTRAEGEQGDEGRDGFARSSIKRMRLALHRARLNGTSDSKPLNPA